MIAAVTVPPWVIEGLVMFVVVALLGIVGRAVFNSFKTWLHEQFETVLKQVTPNGGDTNTNGDITARLENKLDVHAQLDLKVQRAQRRETRSLHKQVKAMHEELRGLNQNRRSSDQPERTTP